jgi:hypothetical protein
MQPNSIQNSEHQENPHDPDEKERELGPDEIMLDKSSKLAVGMVIRISETKLHHILGPRVQGLGADLTPWIGWAEVKTISIFRNHEHPQQTSIDVVVRFEQNAQALQFQIYLNTPWVVRKSTVPA